MVLVLSLDILHGSRIREVLDSAAIFAYLPAARFPQSSLRNDGGCCGIYFVGHPVCNLCVLACGVLLGLRGGHVSAWQMLESARGLGMSHPLVP